MKLGEHLGNFLRALEIIELYQLKALVPAHVARLQVEHALACEAWGARGGLTAQTWAVVKHHVELLLCLDELEQTHDVRM